MAVENRCSPYSGTNALRARTMETNKFCRLATRQHDSAEAVESEEKNRCSIFMAGIFRCTRAMRYGSMHRANEATVSTAYINIYISIRFDDKMWPRDQ